MNETRNEACSVTVGLPSMDGRDIPIIFSAPMVQALLSGRKTMTRRLAFTTLKKPHCKLNESGSGATVTFERPSPWQKVKVGDRLWVRERLQFFGEPGGLASLMNEPLHWAADEMDPGHVGPAIPVPEDWRLPKRGGEYIPSIHMPRWASRLTLVVTGSKVERLQDISKADVLAEGIHERDGAPLADVYAGWHEPFAALWTSLHGAESWEQNPEVVAISFDVVKANIDALRLPALLVQS